MEAENVGEELVKLLIGVGVVESDVGSIFLVLRLAVESNLEVYANFLDALN